MRKSNSVTCRWPLLVLVMTALMSGSVFGDVAPRIVGGQVISDDRYPFMARLYFYNSDQDSFFPGCGGSIISDDAILTAAHCVVNRADGSLKNPDDLLVVLGLTDLTPSNVGLDFQYRVTEIIAHPQYNPGSLRNDIAILRLDRTTNVPRISLPTTSTTMPQDNEGVTVAGWGTTSEGGQQSLQLKAVDLAAVSRAECLPFYLDSTTPVVDSIMFCARGNINGGEDSCQGDSGGPIFASRNGQLVQAGVVSFGEGCARARIPGVYTRVSAFTDWIKSFVPDVAEFQGDTGGNTPPVDVVATGETVIETGTLAEGETDLHNVTGYSLVTLETLSGDADLVIVQGTSFSAESVVCRSIEENLTTDQCAIDKNAAELYAIVYGFKASNYRMTQSGGTPATGPVPPLVSTNPTSGGSGAFDWIMLVLTLPLIFLRRIRSRVN